MRSFGTKHKLDGELVMMERHVTVKIWMLLRGQALAMLLTALMVVPAHADESRTVCFTPGEDCTGLIVEELGKARREIDVQAYSFTSAPIAKALADAKARGVDVRVILDKSQKTERYSSVTFLTNAGIPVWIDDKVAIAHNKVMIIDRETVATGSFNFTRSAQDRNAENLLVLRDAELAKLYERNWLSRQAVSRRYSAAKE